MGRFEGPPDAPDTARGIVVRPGHLVGLLLLFAVPVAALAGVFGVTTATVETRAGDLRLEVEYPKTVRHGVPVTLRVKVHAASSTTSAANAEIHIDAAYLTHFSGLNAQPAPTQFSSEALIFQSPAPSGDEASVIIVDFKAEKTGRAQGTVTAKLDDSESVARVDFSTFIFP